MNPNIPAFYDLDFRQRSEQNRTLAQSRAHFLRQANGRPQAAQTFAGSWAFAIGFGIAPTPSKRAARETRAAGERSLVAEFFFFVIVVVVQIVIVVERIVVEFVFQIIIVVIDQIVFQIVFVVGEIIVVVVIIIVVVEIIVVVVDRVRISVHRRGEVGPAVGGIPVLPVSARAAPRPGDHRQHVSFRHRRILSKLGSSPARPAANRRRSSRN